MAYTKEKIEKVLNDIASEISIDDDLFQVAKDEYTNLGDWIERKIDETHNDYRVYIYPQGSFALGTVIKPITGEDDYDLDLVCLIESGISLSARQLKVDIVKPWLTEYKITKNEIEEKRRCWHVEYEDVPNFHMDVIPAIPYTHVEDSSMIKITNKEANVSPEYTYQRSNPKGYVEWFLNRCKQRNTLVGNADNGQYETAQQEDLKQNKYKTKLQKAVQVLKRHRDVMFKDNLDDKPISIIITTLAAQIYDGEDTILDTILGFVDKVDGYMYSHKKADGGYCIQNPINNEEDFADKWRDHPERKDAFFEWIKRLKEDFNLSKLQNYDRVTMGCHIKKAFGETAGSMIFEIRGFEEVNSVKKGSLKVDVTNGNLSNTGKITVPLSHHFGDI